MIDTYLPNLDTAGIFTRTGIEYDYLLRLQEGRDRLLSFVSLLALRSHVIAKSFVDGSRSFWAQDRLLCSFINFPIMFLVSAG
jgi:hypothetical protein